MDEDFGDEDFATGADLDFDEEDEMLAMALCDSYLYLQPRAARSRLCACFESLQPAAQSSWYEDVSINVHWWR